MISDKTKTAVLLITYHSQDQAGFWEEGGYHMRGNPWNGGDGERFRWQE